MDVKFYDIFFFIALTTTISIPLINIELYNRFHFFFFNFLNEVRLSFVANTIILIIIEKKYKI